MYYQYTKSGNNFDHTYMMKMCEMEVIGYADIAKYVQFTVGGSRVCVTVCKKCIKNIKHQNKPMHLRITLMESYCEMVDKESVTITNLATQCVCVYRVQSYGWQTVIVYKLHANADGLIKIESN